MPRQRLRRGRASPANSQRRRVFSLSVPPWGASNRWPSLWPDKPTTPRNYSARSRSAPGVGIGPGDVEHRRIEPKDALTDRLEHSIDRGRHQRAGAEVTERAFGGIVLVRAAATHDLDNLGRDVQSDLRRQVLGPVGERDRKSTRLN